ncbi:MAG: hypothetical protein K2W93_17805 [Burkholderiaceae bacterium]|nr:hypothetical protein [Burkholderiaceae bacterium]
MAANYALRRSMGADVYEAFRQLVMGHGAEGVVELANFLGQKPGTLYNKADAGDDTHAQPTVRDLIQATFYRSDLRCVFALNRMFGQVCFDAAQYENTSDEALLELLAKLGQESGEFHGALGEGLKAKRFTPEMARRIRAEAFDVVSVLMTLVTRIEDYVDEDDSTPAR